MPFFKLKKLVTLGVLAAMSIVLVWLIHFPLFAPHLEYEPADIPILIGTFLFGPLSGLLLTLVVSVLQGITVSASTGGWVGIVMHFVATGSLVLVVGCLGKIKKVQENVALRILSLVLGVLVMTAVMVVMNFIMVPLFWGGTVKDVAATLLTVTIPFNLVKPSINAILAFIVYQSVGKLLK